MIFPIRVTQSMETRDFLRHSVSRIFGDACSTDSSGRLTKHYFTYRGSGLPMYQLLRSKYLETPDIRQGKVHQASSASASVGINLVKPRFA